MSLLILQIIIQQWDKSQRTPAHIAQRATIPSAYRVLFPPAVYALNNQCIVDQQGDDIQGRRVNAPKVINNAIHFDRFQISLNDQSLAYCNSKADSSPIVIGSLANQWIQCRYSHRYSVFESDRYYWLYEDVILNAIWSHQFTETVFLNTDPVIVYADIETQ